MKRARIFLSLGILTGCAGLIGVPDLTFDEQAEQGSPDGSTSVDGSRTIDGSTPIDGSAPACDESKLQTDPKHCGRCGHDCLGGACNAGKCESVVVKGGLENPVDLVADATSVYVTTRANGTVLRIAKADGKTDVLASGHKEARGVTLDGQNLFWSNFDYDGDGGDGYWGGVWGCALPACSDTRLVATGDHAAYVRFSGGFLYFAENNNGVVVRVKPDGSMRANVGSGNKPFSVAVDSTHVYFQTNTNNFQRALLDGGSQEPVGPLENGGSMGLVTLDAERVYWAYSEYATPKGHVYSALKANPSAPKEEYGSANMGSVGVAVDATMLYWTNQGTFDGNDVNQKDGEVLACPKAGCGGAAPIVLQQGLTSPGAITVTDDAVYFLTFGTKYGGADGELRRIAKP
ncbi:MAG: hypothetical protein BGO98_20355 [Myxococcales bacterium 68-20]|nr:hypothetical protein [Myxococcales bacterium]OJY24225.1 MAG: hypothetical protein BGO98_20355 [Myxococcales bacterium 68-20]